MDQQINEVYSGKRAVNETKKLKIYILVCGDLEQAKLTFSSIDEMAEALKKLEAENESLGGEKAIICNYYWSSTSLV